jgi:hypothetical protein
MDQFVKRICVAADGVRHGDVAAAVPQCVIELVIESGSKTIIIRSKQEEQR